MSPVWLVMARAKEVLEAVEDRLVDGGAVTELRQFQGLSADEVDTLLWLERNDPVAS